MKTAYPELALLVTSRRESGFFHIYAYPVQIGTEGRADSVRNCNDYTRVKGDWFLGALRVYSQAHEERRVNGERPSLYAFEVQYETSRVTLSEARRMVKTLTRVEAALEKLNTKRGYTKSYGEYVARVAEVLGAKRMVFVQTERSNGSWGHDGNTHAFVTLGEGRARIEAIERTWADALQPQAATA